MTTLRDPRGSRRFSGAEGIRTSSNLSSNLADREGNLGYSTLSAGGQYVFPEVDRSAGRSRTADTSRRDARNLQLQQQQRSGTKKKETDDEDSGWRRWTNAASKFIEPAVKAGADIYGFNKQTAASEYAAELQAQATQNALDVEKWKLSQSIPYQRWMAGEAEKEAKARSGPSRAMAAAAFPLGAEHFFGEGADMEWDKWAPADLPPEMTSTDPVNIDEEIAASRGANATYQDPYQAALANQRRLNSNPRPGDSRSGFQWRGILDAAQTVGTLAGLGG